MRYVNDGEPGLSRQRTDDGFVYVKPRGGVVRARATLARINALAIPPAYEEVWICADARGHLQATGRDARGRKQYRYHPLWQAQRSVAKFDRLVAFGALLPSIRDATDRDLALPGLPRRKVLALIVRLLEQSRIRVGNDEYRRANGSFGLTTLQDRHAAIDGSSVRFTFRGKSGKRHRVRIADRRLARLVRRCQELPGQALFQYIDDGGDTHSLGSADVNAYLAELTDSTITAKDFRTWAGTVLAIRACRDCRSRDGDERARNLLVEVVEAVAGELGNTPAVTRQSYIHPLVLEAVVNDTLGEHATDDEDDGGDHGLDADERLLLRLLASGAAVDAH